MENKFANQLSKTEENSQNLLTGVSEAEKNFSYFFTKLSFSASRRSSQNRRASVDKDYRKRISSILGVNVFNKEDILLCTPVTTKTKTFSPLAKKSDVSSQNKTEDIKNKVNNLTNLASSKKNNNKKSPSKPQVDKSTNGTGNNFKKINVSSQNKNNIKPSQQIPNNITNDKSKKKNALNNSAIIPDKNLLLKDNLDVKTTINKRASVSIDEIKSGDSKYEFLINQFSKVFGQNLENFDELGNNYLLKQSFIHFD